MTDTRHSEAAFETVIETHLLSHGYVSIPRDGFDREKAVFPEVVLSFIRETQVLTDLCKWMDTYGSIATLRHGFKCYGRTLYVHSSNPHTG